jgi:hypothetical protein
MKYANFPSHTFLCSLSINHFEVSTSPPLHLFLFTTTDHRLIINDISGQSKLTSASIMASSKLGPFSFLDLPPELRLKIYREIFAGSVIRLTVTQKYSRTAIRDWTPPKHISFLRSSSQIYEESLPILARSSTLELTMEDSSATKMGNRFNVNFEHFLTSPATSLFLQSTLPLVRAMDLDIGIPAWVGRLESIEALTSLEKIWCTQSSIFADYDINQMVGWRFDMIDDQFFQDPAWESKILAAFKACVDLQIPILKDIITAKAGTIRLCQYLWFNVYDPVSPAELVNISTTRKLLGLLD